MDMCFALEPREGSKHRFIYESDRPNMDKEISYY
jgi:hypothetical protein